MISAILSVSPPVIVACAMLSVFWPRGRDVPLLKPFLAAGIGVGVSSSLFFVWSLTFGPSHNGFAALEAGSALFALAWLGLNVSAANPVGCGTTVGEPCAQWLWRFVLGAVVLLAVSAFVAQTLAMPHGEWDAWAIWNLKARFWYRGGAGWERMFTSELAWTHPDYPLLTTGFIASRWLYYLGADDPAAPIVTAALFTFSVAGLLYSAVSLHKGPVIGTLAVVALLAAGRYVYHGATQFADVPLSYYLLSFFVLITLALSSSREKEPMTLALAGAALGMGMWTKNEGIFHAAAAVFCLFLFLVNRRAPMDGLRRMAPLIMGIAPFAFVTFVFKVSVYGTNDLFQNQSIALLVGRATDWPRIQTVFMEFVSGIAGYGPYHILGYRVGTVFMILGVLAVTRIETPPDIRDSIKMTALTLLIVIAGYTAVYILAPQDLQWHLWTSLERLITQLWPSIVYLLAMLAKPVNVSHDKEA